MKKSLMILFLLVFAASVSAVSLVPCSDEDGPKDLNDPVSAIGHGGGASNKTHIVQDICVHTEGGIQVNFSDWAREWYCDGDVLTYKDFNCIEWGFKECYTQNKEGFCRGYSQTPDPFTNASFNIEPVFNATCGNAKIEPPENCDPPGGFCYNEWGSEGACGFDCMCLAGSKPLSLSCGDGNVSGIEECEFDANCTSGLSCSGCQCLNASAIISNVTLNISINLTSNISLNLTNATVSNETSAVQTNSTNTTEAAQSTSSAPAASITGGAISDTVSDTINDAKETAEHIAEEPEQAGKLITSGITRIPFGLFNWLWGLMT